MRMARYHLAWARPRFRHNSRSPARPLAGASRARRDQRPVHPDPRIQPIHSNSQQRPVHSNLRIQPVSPPSLRQRPAPQIPNRYGHASSLGQRPVHSNARQSGSLRFHRPTTGGHGYDVSDDAATTAMSTTGGANACLLWSSLGPGGQPARWLA